MRLNEIKLMSCDKVIARLANISEDVLARCEKEPMHFGYGYIALLDIFTSATEWLLELRRDLERAKDANRHLKLQLQEYAVLFKYDMDGYSDEQLARIKQAIATIDAEVDEELERLEKEIRDEIH